MKDGRWRMVHKAEDAVDLDTGAIVAVTVQGADEGDTSTIVETAIDAAKVARPRADAAGSGREARTAGAAAVLSRRWRFCRAENLRLSFPA